MTSTTGPSLAARLKQATRELHLQAERSGVMVDLLRGRIGREDYAHLLRNLHAIYAALEAGLDRHDDDANVKQLWLPALRRLPALEHDLDLLHATPWRSAHALAPAASSYVERLNELAQAEPQLLLAHAYVRYLGDLHGGQMLAQLIQRSLQIDGLAGTAFYRFGEASEVDALRLRFRTGLDALVLSAAQADALVAEACEAFRRHWRLFEDLKVNAPPN